MQSNEEPVKFLFSDHLGSTTLILDSRTTNEIRDEARYKPYGDLRYQLTSSGSTLPTDLLYTGQRRIAEIGLYYYNARWVDVDTAHFTQPDTVVPDPLNALDWDRYQYVRANPVNFSDPSGHCIFSSHGECIIADIGRPEKHLLFIPTPVNISMLSTYIGTTGISGADFYEAYLQYHENDKGWWWEVWGSDGVFSIWDFFSVALSREWYRYWSRDSNPEAAVRDANEYCHYWYKKSCSVEGYINHFAADSHSAGGAIGNEVPFEDPRTDELWKISYLPTIQGYSTIYNFPNDPSWLTGMALDRPFGWGNISLYTSNQSVVNKLIGSTDRLFAFEGVTDPWFIPSGCVVIYWLGGGRDGTQNLDKDCPKVR